MRPATITPDRPVIGRPVRTRAAVLAAAVALLAASVPAVLAAPASASFPGPIISVSFDGDFDNDAPQAGGTITPSPSCFAAGIDLFGPCILTPDFGTHETLGTYWQWGTVRKPGGGLSLTTTSTIGGTDAYTLAVRFSFNGIDENPTKFMKIVDYTGYRIPEPSESFEEGFYVQGGQVSFMRGGGSGFFAPLGPPSSAYVSSGEVVELIAVRTIEPKRSCESTDPGTDEAPCLTAYLVADGGLIPILRKIDADGLSTPAAVDGGGSILGFFHDDYNGFQYAPGGRVYSVRLWNSALTESEVRAAVGLDPAGGSEGSDGTDGSFDGSDDGTQDGVGGAVGSGPMLIGGALPSLPSGGGELVRPDGTVVTATVTPSGGGTLRYQFDGITLSMTGGTGTSASGGLVADADGEIVLEITAPLVSGGVIEAWMFSEPRLVAAVRVDDLPSQRFVVPVGAPLDGQGPVPAGAHTLQLQLPTPTGMQAVHVGLTIGGPVPTSVPAGEGPGAPSGPFALLAGVAALAAVVLRRRVVGREG
jgi:hypothetical protein